MNRAFLFEEKNAYFCIALCSDLTALASCQVGCMPFIWPLCYAIACKHHTHYRNVIVVVCEAYARQ